jgi:hypothetical protein
MHTNPDVYPSEDPGKAMTWVWMAGATPPRWEIRGTGAIHVPRTEEERRESARWYAEEGPGRLPTPAEIEKSKQQMAELLEQVHQIELEEHQRCIAEWERRFANGAVAVTKHPLEAHRRCRPDLGVHVTPHRGCILR